MHLFDAVVLCHLLEFCRKPKSKRGSRLAYKSSLESAKRDRQSSVLFNEKRASDFEKV